MPEGTKPTKLFVGCFTFGPDPDLAPPGDYDGTFQMLVEALDADDAATKCRARLREIETTTGNLGPVLVYANAFIEVAPSDLIRGVVINHQAIGQEVSYCFLPPQGDVASVEHPLDGHDESWQEPDDLALPADLARLEPADDAEALDDDADLEDAYESIGPVFWAQWKLYWCETPDHDEDWFVVAYCAADAAAFHEDVEGYDDGDADAQFVCVLPDAVQVEADRRQGGWPSDDTLLARGAEFIPHAPMDGGAELRRQLGSGARVVRINGRVFAEGDVLSNVKHRMGAEPDA